MKLKYSIKAILKNLKQYKKFAIITPFFMIGEVAAECLLPFLMSMLGDTIKQIAGLGGNQPLSVLTQNFPYPEVDPVMHVNVLALILTLVGLAMFSMFCGIMGGRFAAKASVGLAANLRENLFERIQNFSFANIDKFHTSSLITRLTTDVNNVQNAFQMMIRIVVRAPLMLVFSAVMSFITGGYAAFIFIALIPVIGVGLFFIGKGAMSIFLRVFKRYDKLNESVQENVTGVRVVKSYVREDFEKEKFNKASNDMTGDFVKAEKIIALNNPLMNTTIHLSNILVLGIGSHMIAATAHYDGSKIVYSGLTIFQISSLLTYGIQILMSLMIISMILVMIIMSLESIRRIGEVLAEEATIKNPENPIMEIKDGSIDFKDVYFKYSGKAEKNTLEDINVHIKSGQFIGVLGSTGSGKTSLINLISRLYDISGGELLVGGEDVRKYDIESLRKEVSVVLQKNVLFSGTISSNLKWGDEHASEEDMWKALEIAQAKDVVMAYPKKLEHPVEQGGANFSGGQKQRLCIARALLRKPKILILDDSTSAVDTKTDKLIRKGLKEELPTMTKIVIAQRISSIEDADQIIIMEDGHINAIGTHDELLKNNHIYKEIYTTQNRVGGEN